MGLVSARFMTPTQLQLCCRTGVTPAVVGYLLYSDDGQRIGRVDDVIIDDESMDLRYLIADTSHADFPVSHDHVMLPASLCCWDEQAKSVRSRATAEQVQSAPPYDRALEIARSYEQTVFTNFGEHPYWPT